MKRGKSVIRAGLVLSLLGPLPSLAQEESSAPAPGPDVARIVARQGGANPVVVLLQAHVLEQEGKVGRAVQKYQAIVEEYPPPSLWGKLACTASIASRTPPAATM